MIIDSGPQIPTSAVFDPSTLMRNKPPVASGSNGLNGSVSQQQQARQRYWSGVALSRPSSMRDATGSGGHTMAKTNNKGPPHQQWTAPAEKEIYTPFKSASGRVTPLDDPYAPGSRMPPNNEYMPVPQDPRERPPSRAASVHSAMLGGLRGEGSVVYQPLSPSSLGPWSNSLMFNKPYGLHFDPMDLPMNASTAPPVPHMQTLPRQLPLARSGGGQLPEEPTHNGRQQVPHKHQPFVSLSGYPTGGMADLNQLHKPEPSKFSGNRVTVMPNGTIIGRSASTGVTEPVSEQAQSNEKQFDGERKENKAKSRQRLSRQREFPKAMPLDREITALKIVDKLSILHILLGLCLFALGVSRLLLLSVWGLGVELVFGVYVVLMGTLGLVGCRRRHHCSLAASFVMSALACVLAIPPFVTGLLVTIPDTFRPADPRLFTSPQEPYSADIVLAAISIVELIVAVVTSAMGCSVIGRKWSRAEETRGSPVSLQHPAPGMTTGAAVSQAPVFTTSVNITHPSIMK